MRFRYDFRPSPGALGTFHHSLTDEYWGADTPPRRSIECRLLLVFEDEESRPKFGSAAQVKAALARQKSGAPEQRLPGRRTTAEEAQDSKLARVRYQQLRRAQQQVGALEREVNELKEQLRQAKM